VCQAPVLNGRVQLVRALPVLSVVLLSGCGIAGTQFHPGVAAEVGDQTITSRHVDKVTDDYCTGFEKHSKSDPQ
jgi:peptidyl-prolyl cis-trans isomerase SurA